MYNDKIKISKKEDFYKIHGLRELKLGASPKKHLHLRHKKLFRNGNCKVSEFHSIIKAES